MTTANDLIIAALKMSGVLGVGQSALAEDMNDALDALNRMIAMWQRSRWLVYHLIDVTHQATGAISYTIGIGQDFNTPRPDRVEAAFFRQNVSSNPNVIDYPLEILESREDYNNIALKTLGSFPSYIFYDSDYPIGHIYVWPLPSNLYEIHLSLKATLQSFPNLQTAIAMPMEYEEAIIYNLAFRLRPMYQLPPEPSITAMAKQSLNILRKANTQIGRLIIPTQLSRFGIYNIFSDQFY